MKWGLDHMERQKKEVRCRKAGRVGGRKMRECLSNSFYFPHDVLDKASNYIRVKEKDMSKFLERGEYVMSLFWREEKS